MKLVTLFISSTKFTFTKLLVEPESSTNIRVRTYLPFFVILPISAVICKQSLLYGNETVQYLQNCQCYNVGQNHL